MLALAAVIPIVCCGLIAAVIAVVAFVGLGKNSDDNVSDGELPQENLSGSTRLEQEKK